MYWKKIEAWKTSKIGDYISEYILDKTGEAVDWFTWNVYDF